MARKIILIVDDEHDVLIYLRSLLEDNDYDTLLAKNVKEAFELLDQERPDLICLDIAMPLESGVNMLRRLRLMETVKAIPVVIITGVQSGFKEFFRNGDNVYSPQAYFEKPIDRESFLEKIKEIIG